METEPDKKSSDGKYYAFSIKLMIDFGFTLAIPAVAAAFLGQYLDEKYNKYPLFLIVCLVVAFIISARIIVTKARHYSKEFENLDKKQKK